MRYPYAFAPSLIALSLMLGAASAQQNPAPQESQKPPQSQAPDQQRGADDAIKSDSGKAGTQEPSSATVQDPANQAPFVNGAWNVPGAPKDSQTVPAKFSKRNAALDKLPILAWPVGFTDAQRKTIFDSIRATNAPVIKLDAKITEELPSTVQLTDFQPAVKSELSIMNDLKYVRLEDRILLVYAPNGIVVGEIKN
jgi:hypothetical protein